MEDSREAIRVGREKDVGMENCVIHVYGKVLCLKDVLLLRIMTEKRKGGNKRDLGLNPGAL